MEPFFRCLAFHFKKLRMKRENMRLKMNLFEICIV